MTTPDIDPFAEDPIGRDQWGRPKIIPLKRKKPDLKAKLAGYTRVSTLADAIGGAGGLITWKLRHAALGLGRREDLAALAGVFGPTVDDLSTQDKKALDAIIERAHEASGGNVKADHGTAVHAFTEPGNEGVVPLRMVPDVDAYKQCIDDNGLEVLDTETFVVNDDVTAAGTFDHRYLATRDLHFGRNSTYTIALPEGVKVIGDKKTGTIHLDKVAIQLATYAHGKLYDPETGERTDLDVSTQWGLLVHIPKNQAEANLYLIDLVAGWDAAKHAAAALAYGKLKTLGYPLAPTDTPIEPAPAVGAAQGIDVTVVPAEMFDRLMASNDPESAPALREAAERRDIAAECHATEAAIKAKREAEQFAIELAEKEAIARAAAEAEVARIKASRDVPTEAEAIATVTSILGAEPVLSCTEKLTAAQSRDELAAVWREHQAEWSDEHTALFRTRAALFPEVAA